MRIAIDASRANTANRTGVEEYVFQICKYANRPAGRHGMQIPPLAGIPSSGGIGKYPDAELVLYTREPLIPELKAVIGDHVTVKVLKWLPKRLWTQMRLSWEMLVHPPNILFVPGHVFPIIHPKKTVMTVHDVAAEVFPESYNFFERLYSVWAARVAVKRLWKVIVPSEFTAIQIGKYIHKQNVHVVPLAYDEKYRVIDDSIAINNVLKKYNIKKPFLLSVGRLETKKNTVRIIQAFNALKKKQFNNSTIQQLVLVGGRGHGYEEVIAEIEQSPYKDNIVLPGYVEGEDLPYIMNAAEVFVFPSLYEGFGIPILEAFACGTPVVTSNTTSCREVAADAAVLVDPLSVESISVGIEEAVSGEHITAGLRRAEGYSWESTLHDILKILLETKDH